MDQIYLSRRNLLTLLSKLDRARAGEQTACTLIKSDSVHPTYPQTVGPCAVTAVEDDQYYDRPAGIVVSEDEPAVDTYLPQDVVECLKLVAEHGTQLGLVSRASMLIGKYVK